MTGTPERPEGLPTRGTTPITGPDDAASKVPGPETQRPTHRAEATPGTPGLPGDIRPGTEGGAPDTGPVTAKRAPVQLAAMVVGIVFLLVGVLGFVPGITTNFGDLSFAGHDSDALLLGLFQVSILHNLVHLLFGIAGLALARTASGARGFLVGGGIVYLVLWVYGLVIDPASALNFVPVNGADNWLHLVLGAGMVALGLVLTRSASQSDARGLD